MRERDLIDHGGGLDAPLLICADLQQYHLETRDDPDEAIARCRSLLDHWRSKRWPVVHLKRVAQAVSFGASPERADWIDGFGPQPGELMFEHALPSAYSSARFTDFMRSVRPRSHFLIGCSLDGTLLSTVIEGYHRGYRHCVIDDASICTQSSATDLRFDSATLLNLVGQFAGRTTTTAMMDHDGSGIF